MPHPAGAVAVLPDEPLDPAEPVEPAVPPPLPLAAFALAPLAVPLPPPSVAAPRPPAPAPFGDSLDGAPALAGSFGLEEPQPRFVDSASRHSKMLTGGRWQRRSMRTTSACNCQAEPIVERARQILARDVALADKCVGKRAERDNAVAGRRWPGRARRTPRVRPKRAQGGRRGFKSLLRVAHGKDGFGGDGDWNCQGRGRERRRSLPER